MPNMSYCRFRNTSNDVYDCLGAIGEIQEGYGSKLSVEESRAGQRMFETILCFCADMGIIEEYNEDRVTELFNELTEGSF